ncbi:MAG: site-specific integrase [Acidimicrobiales bacterium]
MSNPLRVRVIGPLVTYAAGFRAELESQGYRRKPVIDQLYVLAHVSRWLESKGLGPQDFTRERSLEFLTARREAGYTLWLSEKGVAPVLAYLRQVGATPIPVPPAPATPAERLLAQFRSYLVDERNLAPGTVVSDVHVARLFLDTRPPEDPRLEELTPAEVVTFVKEQGEERSAVYVTTGLRAFLRFCHVTARTPRPLVDAVPRVASWRLAGLPKAVDPATVRALLSSCDRRTTAGRRDFAVLMLLSRLGLRSGEVASLCLEDIDWRSGELMVRGKGPKFERLPLPAEVGEAVAAWLRRGRPGCAAREVITRIRAPHGALSSRGIYAIVIASCERAGVPRVHPHRLRHTAATEMLRAGASLTEIGQVLRHQSVLTTAIYAKVDRDGLRELASPWPTADSGSVRP